MFCSPDFFVSRVIWYFKVSGSFFCTNLATSLRSSTTWKECKWWAFEWRLPTYPLGLSRLRVNYGDQIYLRRHCCCTSWIDTSWRYEKVEYQRLDQAVRKEIKEKWWNRDLSDVPVVVSAFSNLYSWTSAPYSKGPATWLKPLLRDLRRLTA